ncbi:single-stranded DNA-binding protein [Campylobacter sputorum subsp. bubulus]|uniref:Single-stranded DNA-binding protein n=1 Tax=Campylobacter sputorum subsp. sputorum TaxID=32024 RepID=A0A381DLJ7_9BACT|nr:single-stranded DNA-binding protein [Campylobacter sputorum]ASM34684.1 single-stranded DNA binding protein [Campylobacter sputorum aubsp. sputorum RM3237]ASM36345.1 single-stranded DNA binding protein [Campylobacter sputorum bv. faecalis CCUG 20703]ASM38026.1 single-stranded DNA binding protein [Campylobacter sputorum bv. paraureolyticus LMG 11764]KAB0581754.1 single-stranded DNA-binding protein [Campylobacter sputorum subsp. sputorum]MDY6120241.1 single-stranded DNA-binding protein [Campyl
MFNKVVLVGNLTRDIELRYSTSGSAIGNSAIAVTRKYSTQGGEKREETCFVDISFFGRTAEIANQYLSKGSKLLVEGRLKFDQWTDNNGQNRSKHSIVVENMEMLGGGNNNQQGGGYSQNYGNQNYQNGGYSQNYNNQNRQSQNSYSQGFSQTTNRAQSKPQDNYYDDFEEKIQEIDVDSDKFDSGDDEIPF